MTLVGTGKAIWILLVVAWYAVRWQFARKASRAQVVDNRMLAPERIRLAVSLTGLGIFPAVYVASGEPHAATYVPHPALLVCGTVLAIGAIVLFRMTHKALGKNWSVSLQMKRSHQLVTTGVYRYVRHPMYSAFWLMAAAQALLLPNWFAGPAGIAGFGLLFFSRLPREEEMMEQTFGPEYRAYRDRTKRIIPFVY